MVVLKKINAATLMETLVASVLIVIVFMISSMILNNMFFNSIKNNTRAIKAHLNELEYLYINKKINTPYLDDFKNWEVSIKSFKEDNQIKILFEATNTKTNKTLESILYESE